MIYLFYKLGFLLLRITTVKAGYAIASFFAKAQYLFSKKDSAIVKANLRNIFSQAGENEIKSLAAEVFVNFAKYLVDFFGQTKGADDYLKKTIRIKGLENFDDAFKAGNGCILLGGHFGNWESAGCRLAKLGYKLNVVALDHKDRRINDFFITQRRVSGVKVIPTGTAVTAYEKALCRNGQAPSRHWKRGVFKARLGMERAKPGTDPGPN